MEQTSAPLSSYAAPQAAPRFSLRRRQAIEAWVILTPILLYYVIFSVAPVIANLVLSFVEWDGRNPAVWVGLDNYIAFFTTPRYLEILGNTFFFALIILLVSGVLGFLVALALNEKVKGLSIYRTFWYIPTLTSAAVMAQIALVFIAPGSGVVSNVLQSLGLRDLIWQVDANFARIFIIIFSTWRGVGVSMLLFLAGLSNISPEVMDAARVDGASGWNLRRYIVVPQLRPTIVLVLVTGLINGFQIFEPVLLITGGQPRNATNVMMLQIYNDAFKNQDFGMAAASATIMLLILLGASLLNMRLLRASTEAEDYEI